VICVYVVLAWLRRSPSLSTMNDDAFYIFLARSLRHFSYVESFVVGSPVHVQYPPGYPAFLALASAAFGEHHNLFVGLNIAMIAGALAITAATVRSRFGRTAAVLVVAACALNPTLIELGGLVRSEALFLLLWSITLWAVLRSSGSLGWTAVTILCAAATTLTRTAGLPLIAGIMLFWAMERRWRASFALGLVALLTVGAWFAWVFHAPQSSLPGASYIADVRAAPQAVSGTVGRVLSIAQRVWLYYRSDIPFTLPMPSVSGTVVDNVLVIVLMTVTLVGGLGAVWRKWPAAVIVGALYMILLAVWPFDAPRFLVPLLPLFFITGGMGAAALSSRLGIGPVAGPAVVSAIVLGTATVLVARDVRVASKCERDKALTSVSCFSPDQVAFVSALRYAGDMASPAAPIVAAKEATAGIMSGHPIVRVTALGRLRPADALAYLKRIKASYIVVGYLEGRDYRLASVLEPECAQLRLAQTFEPRTYVFQITGDSPSGDGGAACAVLRQRLAAWGPGGPIGLW
jgi:hypothetical protein